MGEINLLPQEFKPSGHVISASKTLKKFAIVAIFGLIITLVFFIGTNFFYTKKLEDSQLNKISFERNIRALEETETRLIFIKDRVDKVLEAYSLYRTNSNLATFNDAYLMFPEDSYLVESVVESDGVEISTIMPDLQKVTEYFSSVISSGKFSKISLVSFIYDFERGYVINLNLSK